MDSTRSCRMVVSSPLSYEEAVRLAEVLRSVSSASMSTPRAAWPGRRRHRPPLRWPRAEPFPGEPREPIVQARGLHGKHAVGDRSPTRAGRRHNLGAGRVRFTAAPPSGLDREQRPAPGATDLQDTRPRWKDPMPSLPQQKSALDALAFRIQSLPGKERERLGPGPISPLRHPTGAIRTTGATRASSHRGEGPAGAA